MEATNDNGSCEYPDQNGDCENIAIEEITHGLKDKFIITDLIGRKINTIKLASQDQFGQ